jgi:hypothetical protein
MNKITALVQQGFEQFCQVITEQPLKTKQFAAGDFLLCQGQEILELYWVEMGQFSIEYTANNSRRFSLGLNFVDNHLFGEDEFLTDSRCQFDVCASESIEARVIPVSLMTNILQQDARIAIWLSQSMSERYQTGMTLTMNRFLHPLIYNVAWDIHQRHIGTKPAVNFSQVYKEADRFGSSERVYRRVVKQLVEMRLIEKVDNQLKVTHLDKLSDFLGL